MNSDGSITRLQNAPATLAEMAARSQEVGAQHEARLNSLEDSNRRIAETNRRIAETNRDLAEANRGIMETNRDVAETNQLIVEMIRRHDERLDDFQAARTEAALERLSQTVETILREGRGGQSPG